jgi:DNA repair protein RadD
MFTLRDYQDEGVDAGMSVMNAKRKKAIVVAPTGAGKSLYIASIVSKVTVPVLVLQPSQELLVQNYKKYLAFGGKASIYCASLKQKSIKKQAYTEINGEWKRCDEVSKVTFATVGSVKKEVELLKKLKVRHIIIDEVHLQSKSGSQMRKFIKKLGATNVLGLTATPIYLEGGMNGSRLVMINRTFGTMFKEIAQVTQIKELVDKGYWTPLTYKIIKSDSSALKLNTAGSDYTEHSLKEYYKSNNLNGRIVEEVKRLREEGRQRILIFVPTIEEANLLYGMIPNSAVVHSKLSKAERDLMVEGFTTGDIPVGINVNVLATGYDNPEIDAIITGRPTSSVSLAYQQLGRGVRLHPDKKDCIVVDFSGNVERFGRIEDLTFEEIPYYGWGMFNGKGELLSDYPIMSPIRPTKESLIYKHETEAQFKNSEPKGVAAPRKKSPEEDPKVSFGKHKGKKVSEVLKSDKQYLIWIVDKHKKGEWDFFGESGRLLKKAIYLGLGLPY